MVVERPLRPVAVQPPWKARAVPGRPVKPLLPRVEKPVKCLQRPEARLAKEQYPAQEEPIRGLARPLPLQVVARAGSLPQVPVGLLRAEARSRALRDRVGHRPEEDPLRVADPRRAAGHLLAEDLLAEAEAITKPIVKSDKRDFV
jgi:hypothetical protein